MEEEKEKKVNKPLIIFLVVFLSNGFCWLR